MSCSKWIVHVCLGKSLFGSRKIQFCNIDVTKIQTGKRDLFIVHILNKCIMKSIVVNRRENGVDI
jgi:hypothetical protein